MHVLTGRLAALCICCAGRTRKAAHKVEGRSGPGKPDTKNAARGNGPAEGAAGGIGGGGRTLKAKSAARAGTGRPAAEKQGSLEEASEDTRRGTKGEEQESGSGAWDDVHGSSWLEPRTCTSVFEESSLLHDE